jgi:hypothetical protein
MIKFIKGFFFTIAVLLGYMIVFSITNSKVIENHTQKVGEKALLAADYSVFLGSRYYDENPRYNFTLENEHVSFTVLAYNVAKIIEVEKETYRVVEGLSFVFELNSGTIEKNSNVILKLDNDNEIQAYLIRIAKLPIYSLYAKDGKHRILTMDDLISYNTYHPLVNLSIKNDTFTLSQDLEPVLEDSFILEEPLLTYVNEHHQGPSTDLGVVKYVQMTMKNTFGAVLLATAIYFLIVALLVFCYQFFKDKRHIGRKKPTEGLEKDLERIKNRDYDLLKEDDWEDS